MRGFLQGTGLAGSVFGAGAAAVKARKANRDIGFILWYCSVDEEYTVTFPPANSQ
jgi:hypothetical protein